MLLHDHIDFWARYTPEAEYATDGRRTLSYAQAGAEVERTAAGLLASGCRPGDRVALLAKNCLEYPLLCFAASRVGAVPVTLNYRLAPPEWQYIVSDAGARLLLAQPELADAFDPLRAELPGLADCVSLGAGPEGWTDLREWRDPLPANFGFRPRSTDAAIQMYTSGTTGLPKGAVLSHQALFTVANHWSVLYGVRPGERILLTSPMYHASGLYSSTHGAAVGAGLYVMSDVEPREVVRALDEESVVRASFVPSVIQSMLTQVPDAAQRSYASLRIISYGGSPIAEATLRRAMQVFGCDFMQSYGMTEMPCSTYLGAHEHRHALEQRPELLLSVGRVAPGCQLKIVGEDDVELPPGQIGEICSRGPQIMSGYWNLPEASERTLRGGWMHTGDAGCLDEDGYLYIKDRTKDMIVSGGENVYPREVENVLFEHPGVADVAVIGVPSERWGETVKAIVVARTGTQLDADQLMEYCRGRIGGYKRPRSVDFVDELPRNASGKVLKRELREPYWQGRDRRVG